jgi:L-threonylcarbamoyladenylate synthase
LVVPQAQLAVEAKARSQEGKRVAVMAPASVAVPKAVHREDMPSDADGFARMLYATMRKLDDEGFELLITSFPDEHGLGLAIRDRLSRAAAPRSGD